MTTKYVINARRHSQEPRSGWTTTSSIKIAIRNLKTISALGWEYSLEIENPIKRRRMSNVKLL